MALNLGRIVDLWRDVWDVPEADRHISYRKHGVEDWDDFDNRFFSGNELGIGPKYAVIFELFKESTGGLEEFYAQYDERRAKRDELPTEDAMRRVAAQASRPMHLAQFSSALMSRFMATWLAEVLEIPSDRRETLAELLFTRGFKGFRAVEDYLEWIKFGQVVTSVDDHLPKNAQFYNSRSRAKLVEELDKRLGPGDGAMLVNPFQENMPNGLTALARTLINHQRQLPDYRPYLYLPLRSMSPNHNAPSYPKILGSLKAFFEGGNVLQAPEVPDDEANEVIQLIRHRMCQFPATIILDGYANRDAGSGADELLALTRAIRDDQIVALLARLLDPPLSHGGDEAMNLRTFLRNRIVLLSDRPVEGELRGAVSIAVPLPEADPEMLEKVLLGQRLRNKKTVAEWMSGRLFRESQSEAVMHVLDAIIDLERVAAHLDKRTWSKSLHLTKQAIEAVIGANSGRSRRPTPTEVLRSCTNFLLDRLSTIYPAAYSVLELIALTPDGLRPDTLERLIHAGGRTRYPDCDGNSGEPAELLADLGVGSDLFAHIKRVGGAVVTARRTDRIPGLDDDSHAWEFSVTKASGFRRPNEAPVAMDFRFPDFRDVLLARIDKDHFVKKVQPLMRLLSEDALTQATVAFRHHDHTASVRSFRRMLSCLYHGFQSLPLKEDGGLGTLNLQSPEFGIPEKPNEAWDWLFWFAYRRIIERPPAWSLTRHFGQDRLKQDILRLGNAPWLAWPQHLRPESANEHRGVVEARASTSPRIRSDYYLSASQASFALGEMNAARSALLASTSDRDWQNKPKLSKRMMDIALLEEDERTLFDVEKWFVAAVSGSQAIRHYLSEVPKELSRHVSELNFAPVVRITLAGDAVNQLVDIFGPDEDKLSQISGVLFRLGEHYAIKGDTQNAVVRLQEMAYPLSNGDAPFSIGAYEPVMRHFCRSMMFFRLAEALRLRVFSNDPTGQNFFASGHSARQMIRVGLKLEQQARRIAGSPQTHGFFARRSRHMANVLARHLFRFPRERASMLILEATMVRLLSTDANRALGLLSARRILDRAEPVVLGLGDRTRVRMRFALERVKIHRRMAKDLVAAGDVRAHGFFDLARADVELLAELNKEADLLLWHHLIKMQSDYLDAIPPPPPIKPTKRTKGKG